MSDAEAEQEVELSDAQDEVLLKPEDWFSDQDRLRLVQLLALRSCRENRSSTESSGSTDTGQPEEVGGPIAASPGPWRLLPEGAQLHPWQQEALEKWLMQRRGTLQVATGAGKTWFALAAIERLYRLVPGLRVAIVVPTIALMNQWHEELSRSSLSRTMYGRLGGGHQSDLKNVRILICVLNSARTKLTPMVREAGVADRLLLIADESHRIETALARKVFSSRPAFTLGLSATPGREEGGSSFSREAYEKSETGILLGPIFYSLTLLEARKDGLLTPFTVHHIGVPLTDTERAEYDRISRALTDARKRLKIAYRQVRSRQAFEAWVQTRARAGAQNSSLASEYVYLSRRRKHLLYHSAAREHLAAELLKEALSEPGSQVILFHEVIAPVDRLFRKAVHAGLPVVLEHSKLRPAIREEALETYRQGIAHGILSAKTLIEGFNVPSADVGIIAAANAGVRQRVQTLGRLLRKKQEGRTANVYVLYCANTTDELLYEKFDQASLVGSESNIYYTWTWEDGVAWRDGLRQASGPPRQFLPLPEEIDVSGLKPGDIYPARPEGQDVKVDQDLNVRFDDGSLVEGASGYADVILGYNPYRRARLTKNRHLIVHPQRGSGPGTTDSWLFLAWVQKLPPLDESCGTRVTEPLPQKGNGAPPPKPDNTRVTETSPSHPPSRLLLKPFKGKRRIVKPFVHGGFSVPRGPDSLEQELLRRIGEEEGKSGIQAKSLYALNGTYWVEIRGQRLLIGRDLPELDYPVLD